MNVFVTGAAGFIGANLVLRLLESQELVRIVGLDNLNQYYNPSLKDYRLGCFRRRPRRIPNTPTVL